MQNQILDKIERLLSQQRLLLKSGALGQLGPLADETVKLVTQISARRDVFSAPDVQRLHRLASENQRLLIAAREGVLAARHLINRIMSEAQSLKTYTKSGTVSLVNTRAPDLEIRR